MTEPSRYNVDPGESDASTKLVKGTNVKDSIKIPKFESKTYNSDNPKKFQDLQSQKVPSSHRPVYAYKHLERYYHKGELNLSGKRLSHSQFNSLAYSLRHELKKLDLSGCGLTDIDLHSLENCHGLEELNLSNNDLHDVYSRNYLGNMSSLKKLDLSGCSLTYTPLFSLRVCHRLEELNLSNNPLCDISSCNFWEYVSSLKKLDLSGCGLTDIDLYALANSQGLEELNLSNNPLHDFVTRGCRKHTFSSVVVSDYDLTYTRPYNLRKLNLSGCCLTKWPSGLERYSSLQELNLSNNSFGHQDLFENLNNGKMLSQSGLHKSEKELLKPPPSVLGFPNLSRIIFEDGVYTKNDRG